MTRPARATRSTSWGGARHGAGRPARGAIASEPHKPRAELAARHPVHVIARVGRELGTLRRRRGHVAIRRAVHVSLARTDFRIVRLALRATRIELVVEADDKHALARGMQGFQIAAARALNAARGRTGTVFPDRYRPTILRTRRAVRGALAALPARPPAVVPAAPVSPITWLLRIELAHLHARPP